MKVLVIGSGGREHAVVKKLCESKKVTELYCAPGNAGIAKIADCINIKATEIKGITEFSKANGIDLVVVTPDDPLALGMVNELTDAGIRAFGPVKEAAMIESSKAFAKDLMKKYGIPTGAYRIFTEPDKAAEYLKKQTFPCVLKASGLALGKGVIIAKDLEEAIKALNDMMTDKKFGASGETVIIEEFLRGPEVTALTFTDGSTIRMMPSSQDHKRALDNDKGLNTGGMGAFSPSRYYTKDIEKYCYDKIFMPTMEALNKEGRTFKGVIYFQLMLTKNGPKVIEYNARFGDPETEAILPLLETDLLDIFDACIDGRLDKVDIKWKNKASATVVLASGGYPEAYQKGYEITGLDDAQAQGLTIYHMGTKTENGKVFTNGGRVLAVTSLGDTVEDAVSKVYNNIERVHFTDMHYRKDIGRK